MHLLATTFKFEFSAKIFFNCESTEINRQILNGLPSIRKYYVCILF